MCVIVVQYQTSDIIENHSTKNISLPKETEMLLMESLSSLVHK